MNKLDEVVSNIPTDKKAILDKKIDNALGYIERSDKERRTMDGVWWCEDCATELPPSRVTNDGELCDYCFTEAEFQPWDQLLSNGEVVEKRSGSDRRKK